MVMHKKIRNNVFETNSSSMHALSLYCDTFSILSESEFEDFKKELMNNGKQFIQETDKPINKSTNN